MQKQYCPYCMKPVAPGTVCQGCGKNPESYQSEAHHYPAGQLLSGRYLVGRALGEGGFGITYLGFDTKLERRVAIKEYFPRSLVRRDTATTLNVTCYTGSAGHFEKGREQFLREAQVLAKLDAYPEIVHVLDYFAENNSAYIVMEFLEGITLKDMVAQSGIIAARELLDMLEPVIKSLDAIHAEGLIHRDISPDNLILLHKNKQVKLMDFGCARELGMGHTMTVMLKPGFAPAEQYTGREQGSWSDVYSLCATIYYCLTGKIPMEAMARMGSDRLLPPSKLGMGIDPKQEKALLRGLALDAENRWRTAADLYAALYGKTISGVPVVVSPADPIPATEYIAETPTVVSEPEKEPDSVVVVPPSPEIPTIPVEESGATEFIPPDASGKTEFIPPDALGETEFIPPDSFGETEFIHMDTPGKSDPEAPKEDEKEKPVVIPFWKRFALLPKKKKAVICGSALLLLLLLGFAAFWLWHPHRYGDWTVRVAAGCTEDGTEIRSCFCGSAESRTITATGHVTVADTAIAATCTETGKTEGKHCSVCQEVFVMQKDTPMLPHQSVETPEVPATCSQEGSTAGQTCSVCNTTIAGVMPIPKLPHTPADSQPVAATCATEGKSGGKECSVCKEILEEPTVTEKLPHTPVAGRNIAATCTAEGRTGGKECSVCQEILEEPTKIDKIPHKEVTDKAVAATCSKEGKTEGSHCSACNTVIKKQQTIAKTAHKEVTDKAVTATCDKPGKTEGSHCSVCNTVIRAQTEITVPHKWSRNICTVCGRDNITVNISFDKDLYKPGETITVTAKIGILDPAAGNEIDYRHYWSNDRDATYTEKTWKNCYNGQVIITKIAVGTHDQDSLVFGVENDLGGPEHVSLAWDYVEVDSTVHRHEWKANVCPECGKENASGSLTVAWYHSYEYIAKPYDTFQTEVYLYGIDDASGISNLTVTFVDVNNSKQTKTVSNPKEFEDYTHTFTVGSQTGTGYVILAVDGAELARCIITVQQD